MSVHVGMAEMKFSKGPERFVAIGLGSCIGLAAIDPVSGVGGMLHVMLPNAFDGEGGPKPGKFADTGVPAFVKELEKLGAVRRRLKLAIAGGAEVFRFGDGKGSLQIGARNATEVDAQLRGLGLRASARDVGGERGRTMSLDTATGEVRLRVAQGEERELCRLAA